MSISSLKCGMVLEILQLSRGRGCHFSPRCTNGRFLMTHCLSCIRSSS